jgi:pyridoxal phosphate enzyme (YggS family)
LIAENIQNVRTRIRESAERAGRKPEDITLVAVTKTFTTDAVREALAAGLRDFGENYVQELRRKYEDCARTADAAGDRIRWHFIGHLQSNKLKYIAEWIHRIHAVDSLDLGTQISRWGTRLGTAIRVLVEVNTSGEPTKYGVAPGDAPRLVNELVLLPGVSVEGLMTMAPYDADPEECRPSFRALKGLKDKLQLEGLTLPHLSMGMTNDFEVAIEEGSTIVRIGTAIFGRRTP